MKILDHTILNVPFHFISMKAHGEREINVKKKGFLLTEPSNYRTVETTSTTTNYRNYQNIET